MAADVVMTGIVRLTIITLVTRGRQVWIKKVSGHVFDRPLFQPRFGMHKTGVLNGPVVCLRKRGVGDGRSVPSVREPVGRPDG